MWLDALMGHLWLDVGEPNERTMRQMDRKPTGLPFNLTARQMDHNKNGQTDYWTACQMDHNWTSLGSTIDGELKLAAQLSKGDMILGIKKDFQ